MGNQGLDLFGDHFVGVHVFGLGIRQLLLISRPRSVWMAMAEEPGSRVDGSFFSIFLYHFNSWIIIAMISIVDYHRLSL